MQRECGRSASLRNTMVDSLKSRYVRCMSDRLVEDAFRAVSREVYVPGRALEEIYRPDTLVTHTNEGGRATISSTAPQMMAVMIEQLGVGRRDNVLEIGTGTGYNAAILAHILGPEGHVTTLDIDERAVASVRSRMLAESIQNISVILNDGARGYLENAPYDGIIATASPFDVPPQWVAQMKPTGRLVVPLALRNWLQRSIAFERVQQSLVSRSIRSAGFMYMKGILEPPVSSFPGGSEVGLDIAVYDTTQSPMDLPDLSADRSVGLDEIGSPLSSARIQDLNNWILLREPCLARISLADTEHPSQNQLSRLMVGFQQEEALGVIRQDSIAVLLLVRHRIASRPFFLPTIAHCGSGDLARSRLIGLVKDWSHSGMPVARPRRVEVRSKSSTCDEAGQLVIPKLWNELIVQAS